MAKQFETVEKDGKSFVQVPPNAARTVRAMGRLSYNFEKAIADLIDNSIAAHATKIEVLVEQRVGGRVYVHVLDNGQGISRESLPSSMQYGADDRGDDKSLGIYGFGLKTACQSFTEKFVVVSKTAGSDDINMITFDEAVIKKYNDYLFFVEKAPQKYTSLLVNFIDSGSGALVATEDAGRFFPTEKGPEDERKAQKFIAARVKIAQSHLRKVFQRFLDIHDARAPNVAIAVNDEWLSPWDPFCLKEKAVRLEGEKSFTDLQTKAGKTGNVTLRGYILPSKFEFGDQELYKDADIGPNTHGVYVFRENRLLEQATYFDLYKRETHHSNLRVEFSFDGTLDEMFHPGLQKGSMILGDLTECVRDFLRPLLREADLQSRSNSRKKDTRGIHDLSQKTISATENLIPHAKVTAIDSKTATVVGKYGEVILPIPSTTDSLEAIPINPVDSIDDGHLWQMRLHNGKQVIALNKGHEYYARVYLPNKENSIAIRGLDMVFWALAITEANCTIPEYQKQFREFRFEVSRALRDLSEQLPEPRTDDSGD